jgi:regulator of protease activity HflC (stomatin/prohibitin superfamily)
VIDAMSVFALPGLLALGLLVLLLAGVRRVPEGSAYTVHRFGRFVRTLPPGFGFVMPLVERIGQRVSLIGHTVSLGEGAAEGAVYYQILDPRQAGADIESVDQLVASAATATLQSNEAGEERSDLQFRQRLNQLLAARGLRVVRCVLPVAQPGH